MPLTREPDTAREFTGDLLGSSSDEPGSRNMRLSSRQRELNNLWSYFRVCEHDGKGHEWDGRPVLAGEMWDAVQKEGVVPPGMENAGDIPRDLRRPVAPLGIVRNIVSRFTGLLFSNRKQPRVLVPDDERTEDYLGALLKQGQFWAAMTQARNYGGATGSACVGFKILDGRCTFEALDPRWTEPEFAERGSTAIEKLTIQYTYPKEEKQPNGRYKKVWYWYRRVVDRENDTTWKPIKCRQNEPRWDYMQRNTIPHGLGFVPYEWIQNLRSDDEIDGDSDCHGAYKMLEAVDQLVAEVWYGTVSNCVGSETEFISSTGVRRFADCSDGEHLTVLSHTGAWKPATVHSYGQQKLFKIRFGRQANSQTVRATEGHRWLLDDGRIVTTGDLKPGTKILKPPHLIRDWSFDESSEEQKRYWAQGFAYGDGSVCKRGASVYGCNIRLCGKKSRFVQRFEALGCSVTYPPSSDHEPNVFLRGYGKTLPDVEVDGLENTMAFVRGLLDADGSRNLKHPETADINPFQGIQATGTETINFIRKVFPIVGAYIVNEDDRTDQPTNFGIRGGETVYFSLVLGFSNSPVAPYIVREVTPDVTETVWCLEVEDDKSFVLPCGLVSGNCDPTLTISSGSQDNPGSVKKGSDNALFMGADSSAAYLELAGSGPQTGLTVLEKLEDRIYRLCQCVPDQVLFQNNGEKTAMEIERIFSSMVERADSLREQYGPAIIRICELVLRAVRTVEGIRIVEGEDGQPRKIRYRVYVAPRVIQQPDGDQVTIPRVVGNGKVCDLLWPQYFKPSLTDIETAQRIATTGKDSEVFTKESAIKYWMSAAGLDPLKEIHALKKAEESAAMSEAAAGGEEGAPEGEEAAPEGAEGPDAMTWKEALAQGICTINEYREGALQLGAIPDGDLTLVQYRAKHQDIWVSNTAAQSQEMVKAMVAASQPKPDPMQPQQVGKGQTPPQNAGKSSKSSSQPQAAKAGTSPSSSKPGSTPARPNNAPAKKPSGQTPSKQTKSIPASKPEPQRPLPLLKPTSSPKSPA